MLPPLALDPEPGATVLDMAASPGSKTGFLAQLVGANGLVLGNEPNPARLATLRANLQRANLYQAVTSAYAGEKLPLAPDSWQYILLDPPCSGWGTSAKNPRATKIWQGAKINRLVDIQRKLLAKAAELLAPGGKLLYSTCTTNMAENEAQTEFSQKKLGLTPLPLQPFAGFAFHHTTAGALLVDGEASEAQGFYLSLLQKPGHARVSSAGSRPEFPFLPASALAGPLFDPSLLPAGQVAVFGNKARFLPAQCGLPTTLSWQAMSLGKWSNGRFTPAPRLRICLPAPDKNTAVVFENIEQLRRLLHGMQIHTNLREPAVALWWRNLPLGTCQNRNGRLTCSFR